MQVSDKTLSIKNTFKRKHIISLQQFSPQSLEILFKEAQKLSVLAKSAKPSKILAGKIVTLLFYEPSSRTMSSFDAAVKQLGGSTLVMHSPQTFSSVSKGETFEDTIRVFEAYSDAIVLRHHDSGMAKKATEIVNNVPIINAGDGVGEHPTQALLDLFTIWEKEKSLTKLTGLVVGDLKNGRTVHSLLKGLALYKNNHVYLLSPRELNLDKEFVKELTSKGLNITEIESYKQIPNNCHFWYWTRVQKERFKNKKDYLRLNNKFILGQKTLDNFGNKNLIVMHPLPRVGEISTELDSDPRSVYLKSQIRNGMYIRMALLSLILE